MAAAKGNKYALGNNGGQPPYYSSPEQLEKKIVEYFDYIQGTVDDVKKTVIGENGIEVINYSRRPEPPTVTGLTLFLGFCDKQSLLDYTKKQEFSFSIKRAKTIIEQYHEFGLGGTGAAGHIFALKNFKWTDKIELETTNKNYNSELTPEERDEKIQKLKDRLDGE